MNCQHNNMVLNDGSNATSHVWKCADCGYVYGEAPRAPGQQPQNAPQDTTKSTPEAWPIERQRLRNLLRLVTARLAEYPDAEGGTALELARRELR